MSDLSIDSAEEKLGRRVSVMDPVSLFAYCQESHKRVYGYPMAVEYTKALGITRWLKKTYGSDAGEILKWIFTQYNGRINGQNFSLSMCSSNWSWFLEQMRHEMKTSQKLSSQEQQPLMGKFATGADFLKKK